MRNNILRYIMDPVLLCALVSFTIFDTVQVLLWQGHLTPEFSKYDMGSYSSSIVVIHLLFIATLFLRIRLRIRDAEKEKSVEGLLAGQLNLAESHDGTLSEIILKQAVNKMLANPMQFEMVLSHLTHHTKRKMLSTLVSIHAIEVQQIAAASNVPFGTAQYERANKWIQSGRELNRAADQLAKLLGEKEFISSHTGSKHHKPSSIESGKVQSGPGITK